MLRGDRGKFWAQCNRAVTTESRGDARKAGMTKHRAIQGRFHLAAQHKRASAQALGLALQVAKCREQPRAHADQQGIGTLLFLRQLLVGQVLVREVLRHPLQPLVEQRGQATADLAVHQHQHLAFTVETAAEIVANHLLAKILHHRTIGAPAKRLGHVQAVAVQRTQLDDTQSIELDQVLHALGVAERVAGDDLFVGPLAQTTDRHQQQLAIGHHRLLLVERQLAALAAWCRPPDGRARRSRS